jgi:hypothetical protein
MLKTIIFSIACFALGALLFATCEQSVNHNPDQIKDTINTQLKQKQIVKTVVIIKDSIVTKYLTKYKTIRHDSLIPCETKLVICDTLIQADSSLIFSLKQELFIDSIILGNYATLASRDSSTIAKLDKKLKRAKKINRILSIVTIGAIGVAVLK